MEKRGLFLEEDGVLCLLAPPNSTPPEILKQKPTGPPRVGLPDLANENAKGPITFEFELNNE